MSDSVERIIDILVFASGIVLLIVGVIFLQLYFRYKRRDYFLYILALFAAAVQATVGEMDTIIPESWGTEVLELISAIFSFLKCYDSKLVLENLTYIQNKDKRDYVLFS